MISVFGRGEEAHGCGARGASSRRLLARRSSRVASSQWEVGELDSLNPGVLPSVERSRGSPAAAPFLEPRRRESPRGAAVRLRLQFCSPKCASETRLGLPWIALTKARAARAGAPGEVFGTQPGARSNQNSTANIGDTICLVSSPNNSPAAGGARQRHRLCERRPALHIGSRAGQPVAAAAAPPGGRGSLSLLSTLHLQRQRGRRRFVI